MLFYLFCSNVHRARYRRHFVAWLCASLYYQCKPVTMALSACIRSCMSRLPLQAVQSPRDPGDVTVRVFAADLTGVSFPEKSDNNALLCVQVIDNGGGPGVSNTAALFRPLYQQESSAPGAQSLVDLSLVAYPLICCVVCVACELCCSCLHFAVLFVFAFCCVA